MGMHDPQDRLELGGRPAAPPATATSNVAALDADAAAAEAAGRRFLSVWYACCHAYGRLSRNRARTAFEGACPRCGRRARARIGPGGSTRRVFEAR